MATFSKFSALRAQTGEVMRDGRTRREFWELWWVRVAVVAVVAVAVITVSVLIDPTHASWEAKTWEFVHEVAAASVGRK